MIFIASAILFENIISLNNKTSLTFRIRDSILTFSHNVRICSALSLTLTRFMFLFKLVTIQLFLLLGASEFSYFLLSHKMNVFAGLLLNLGRFMLLFTPRDIPFPFTSEQQSFHTYTPQYHAGFTFYPNCSCLYRHR